MRTGYIIVFLFLFLPGINFGQQDTCEGRLSLAEDFYTTGDFEESLRLLDLYKGCRHFNSSDYYKLLSKINIAQDNKREAKSNIARYITSKAGNHLSDNDPQLFKDLFYEVLDSLSGRLITSVSKRPEDADLAAATVIVIKESEFATRGYLDIVDLLADQPGFDISRLYSATYANAYQRGFRQENTERTLLMIDGVEENDVWSNIAYLSRQYPLSNISAVEIIYGPASTMYGARAFAGTINIITKSHKEMQRKSKSGEPFGIAASAKAQVGSYNSRGVDVNVSGKNKNVAFLLTGRMFSTNGADLSGAAPFYDYSLTDLDNLNYDEAKLKAMSYTDNPATTANELDDVVNRLALTPGSPYYNYFTGYGTGTLTINPDSVQSLLAKARKIDKENYLKTINGNPVGYSNSASNYYFGGKIKFDNVEAGFRTWKTKEGFNYYQDLFAAGTNNGSSWAPTNTTFYTIYDKKYKNVSLSNTSSYVIHGLNKDSRFVSYNSFYGALTPAAYSNPILFNLIFPDSIIDGRRHGWTNTYFYYKARQFRNDLRVNYTKNRLNLLAGADLRSSQLQGDYLQYRSFATATEEDQSRIAYAEDLGTVVNQDKGGNQYNTFDAGIYSQLTYKVKDSLLYLTAGGRYDYNRIRSNGGFGGIFNPKVAAVLTVKNLVSKLIYSRGIQNPSQFTKFATGASRNANPTLAPESIQNIELSVQNRRGTAFSWDLAGFYSIISNAVSSLVDPADPKKAKNQNSGEYRIYGAQGNIRYAMKRTGLTFYFNTSLTFGKQTEELSATGVNKTIADIAPIKFNFIVNYNKDFGLHNLNLNLRTNFVGSKTVGPETTVPLNKGLNNSEIIPAYTAMFASMMYKHRKFDFVTMQFTVNNLLNSLYYSPGPRTANGNYVDSYNGFVQYVPQPGLNFLFTLMFNL